MPLLLTGVRQMAFETIGFHAALILNRLRNERRIEEDRRADEEARQNANADEKAVGAELERLNKRLALLRARV
jgi:hypothetical protein